MRAVTVVVDDIALQDRLEMAAPEDEDAIEALTPQGSHEPFRECVRKRCLNRGTDNLRALGGEYLVEASRVFRVTIPDEEAERKRVPSANEVACQFQFRSYSRCSMRH